LIAHGGITRRVDSLIGELRQGRVISVDDLDRFTVGVDDGELSELYAELICTLIRDRLERGEKPWISDYLSDVTAAHREQICRAITRDFFREPAPEAVRLGVREFDGYVATQLIGFGGFGSVFKGYKADPPSEAVAIKLAHPRRDDAVRSLRNEVEALDRLNRAGVPGVPLLKHHGKSSLGSSFLVMNHIDGLPLHVWLANRSPAFQLRLEICRSLALTFSRLHSDGKFNHGDVAPHNIMISGQDHRPVVTVIDFGSSSLAFTPNPLICATRRYAAPEVLEGKTRVPSIATDLWSLGVVLWETFGDHPFGNEFGADMTLSDIDLAAHAVLRASAPAELADRAPDFVSAIVGCLEPDATLRMQRVDCRMLAQSIPGPRVRRAGDRSTGAGSSIPRSNGWINRPSLLIAAVLAAAIAIYSLADSAYLGARWEGIRNGQLVPSTAPASASTEAQALEDAKSLRLEADREKSNQAIRSKLDTVLKIVASYDEREDTAQPEAWMELHCNTLSRIGISYIEDGQLSEAEKQFVKILTRMPKPHHWRGVAFAQLGDICCMRLDELQGKDWDATKRDGIQKYRDAIAVFSDRAVGQRPEAQIVQGKLDVLEAREP
jgi:serine/threonine protein kinase